MEIHTLARDAGYTIFNDTSSAAGASIFNAGRRGTSYRAAAPAATIFNGTSTAGHATITNDGGFLPGSRRRQTIFNDSSTADSAILVANEGDYRGVTVLGFFLMVLRRAAPRG